MIDYGFINENNTGYDTREINSRIITLDEYKKSREDYRYSVPYINLTVDSPLDEHNMIAVYDERKKEYYYINNDGVTIPIKTVNKPLFSYLVIDLNIYNPKFAFDSNFQIHGQAINYAYAPVVTHTEYINGGGASFYKYCNYNNEFKINSNEFKTIKFGYYNSKLNLTETDKNEMVLKIILENNTIFHGHPKPDIDHRCIWKFDPIEWTYNKTKNILISTHPYYTGFNFPIKNDPNYNSLITSADSKTYKQSMVDQLHEKATSLVSNKNIFENTPIKYINKLFDIDNYIDEYYDFGANSLKQIYINDNNKHGFDVTFSEYDLKVKIKPTWYNDLCKICTENYPLNVNLVIDITENTDINIINNITDESLIYNKWQLPSNCMIVLISEHKDLIEKCSNQYSTNLIYTDTKFRSIKTADDEGLYVSVNYSKNKNKITEDIRDDFLTTDDEYIVLESGRESVKMKKEVQKTPNIPLEYYEEFYLKPHRKKIDEQVRKRIK